MGWAAGGAHSGDMSTSELLVTPAQRDRAVEILQEMYADGRLDHVEFDTPARQLALKSRTRAELNGTFDGLVSRPVPTYAPAAFTRPAPAAAVPRRRAAGWARSRTGSGTRRSSSARRSIVATAGKQNPAVRKHAVEALNFQLSAFGVVRAAGDRRPGSPRGSPAFLFPIVGHGLVRADRHRRPGDRCSATSSATRSPCG